MDSRGSRIFVSFVHIVEFSEAVVRQIGDTDGRIGFGTSHSFIEALEEDVVARFNIDFDDIVAMLLGQGYQLFTVVSFDDRVANDVVFQSKDSFGNGEHDCSDIIPVGFRGVL